MDLFLPYLMKGDKKSQVNNLNIYTTIEAKIFRLIAIKLKAKDLLNDWNRILLFT